jgi:hypothetical protein
MSIRAGVKPITQKIRRVGPFPDGTTIGEWTFPHDPAPMEMKFSFDLTVRLQGLRKTIVIATWLADIEAFIRDEIIIESLARPESFRP